MIHIVTPFQGPGFAPHNGNETTLRHSEVARRTTKNLWEHHLPVFVLCEILRHFVPQDDEGESSE